MFCGSESTELWDMKVLFESTRCDHGYNLNSRAVKWLFDIMINFNLDEQRAFLQFVTGCPRLPVGGSYFVLDDNLNARLDINTVNKIVNENRS